MMNKIDMPNSDQGQLIQSLNQFSKRISDEPDLHLDE